MSYLKQYLSKEDFDETIDVTEDELLTERDAIDKEVDEVIADGEEVRRVADGMDLLEETQEVESEIIEKEGSISEENAKLLFLAKAGAVRLMGLQNTPTGQYLVSTEALSLEEDSKAKKIVDWIIKKMQELIERCKAIGKRIAESCRKMATFFKRKNKESANELQKNIDETKQEIESIKEYFLNGVNLESSSLHEIHENLDNYIVKNIKNLSSENFRKLKALSESLEEIKKRELKIPSVLKGYEDNYADATLSLRKQIVEFREFARDIGNGLQEACDAVLDKGIYFHVENEKDMIYHDIFKHKEFKPIRDRWGKES